MDNVNNVTIEAIDSLAKKYNKPKVEIVPEKKITIIDKTATAQAGAQTMALATTERPLSRIATLEKQMEDVIERLNDLEELMWKVLRGE